MSTNMPAKSVLVLGPGSAGFGELDATRQPGAELCRALRSDGIRVIAATADPDFLPVDADIVDATYVVPLAVDFLEKVIARERPSAIFVGLGDGGAAAIAVALVNAGVLERGDGILVGPMAGAIDLIRNWGQRTAVFERACAGLSEVRALHRIRCSSMARCIATVDSVGGYPVLVRPGEPITTGWSGAARLAGGPSQLAGIVTQLLTDSPTGVVYLEERGLGWRHYQLEMVRDHAGEVVTLCSLEIVDAAHDPLGGRTVVAPAITLTGDELRALHLAASAVLREAGVIGAGCSVRLALDPAGQVIVMDLLPRFSSSSALAARLTGLPIAGIAARIAMGHRLSELPFDTAEMARLGRNSGHLAVRLAGNTCRRGCGMGFATEALAVARSVPEAVQKALRSWDAAMPENNPVSAALRELRAGTRVTRAAEIAGLRPWFVAQLSQIERVVDELTDADQLRPDLLRRAKVYGLSDARIGEIRGTTTEVVRGIRQAVGIRPGYWSIESRCVDSLTRARYRYSSYAQETAPTIGPDEAPAVLVIGGGPRPGSSNEAGLSCTEGLLALRATGHWTTVTVECDPAATTTDQHTADRVYLEPITVEDMLELVDAEIRHGALSGVIAQLRGPTPQEMLEALRTTKAPSLDAPLAPAEAVVPSPSNFAENNDNAVLIAIDALYDGTELYLAGLLECVRRADADLDASTWVLPSLSLLGEDLARLRSATNAIAHRARSRGLINVWYALRGNDIHVLGVRTYASPSLPFVSAVTSTPVAAAAALVATGRTIAELRATGTLPRRDGGNIGASQLFAVREPVVAHCGSHLVGQVMAIGRNFGSAYAAAQYAAGHPLPKSGKALITLDGGDRRSVILPLSLLAKHGFEIFAPPETLRMLRRHGIEGVAASEAAAATADLVLASGAGPAGTDLRSLTARRGVPCATTTNEIQAVVHGILSMHQDDGVPVVSVQDLPRPGGSGTSRSESLRNTSPGPESLRGFRPEENAKGRSDTPASATGGMYSTHTRDLPTSRSQL